MKKIIVNDNVRQVAKICSESLAYIFIVCLLVTSYLGIYIEKYGYEVNYSVLFRLALFGSIVSLVVVRIVLRELNLSSNWNEWKNTSLFFFFAFFVAAIYYLVGSVSGKANIRGVNLLICFYFVYYALGYSDNISSFFLAKRVKCFFIAIFVLMALGFPVLTGKIINLESYLSVKELGPLRQMLVIKNPQSNEPLLIKLSPEAAVTTKSNIERNKTSKNKNVIGEFYLNEPEATFRLAVNGNNLQAVCLLGDYEKLNQKLDTLDACVSSFVSLAGKSEKSLRTLVAEIPFVDQSVAFQVLQKINQTYLDNIAIEKGATPKERASVMMVRGAYFHHYNSIARSVIDTNGISSFFSNQYGFGPLFFTKITSVVTGLSTFDSIYVATVISNLIVFVLLVVILIGDKQAGIVWLGFSVSILATYFLSNMMAPFLYYVRYLPTIFLVLLLFYVKKFKFIDPEKEAIWRKILFFAVMSLVSVYNFEYAILTCLGVLVGGALVKNKFYIVSGLMFLVVAIALKKMFADPTAIGANYLGYIAGTSIDGRISDVTYLFFAAIGLTFYRLYKSYDDLCSDSDLIVGAMIIVMLCAKIAWIGSPNHIGPLFLLLAILYSRVSCSHSSNLTTSNLRVNYLFPSFYIAILVITISYWGMFHYNVKFSGINYVKSNISSIFSMPQELDRKLRSIEEVYEEGALVLSPIDNAIALHLRASVSLPYPDVSTNINSPLDSARILKAYVDNPKGQVIVDKAIIEMPQIIIEYSDVLIGGLNLGNSVNMYADNIKEMSKIYFSLQGSGFHVCRENAYFVVLCR